MSDKPIDGEKRVFMMGNEVVAWAALAAGADIMYGYPITPQNQVMHYWSRLAPLHGRKFLQTEDEISAGFTMLGGVLSGKRAFTASSGPGNVIMQDAFSMAEMMRLPSVAVIQQRGGPSTATVIYSQQEVVLTTHGGNGEGIRIVYSTNGHQDMFDYVIKAFNVAWKYRFPTFVLGDGYQGEMRETLTIYDPAARGIEMVPTEAYVGRAGTYDNGRLPNHLRNTYNIEEELEAALMDIFKAYDDVRGQIEEWEQTFTDDAQVVIIAHGIVARSAKEAANMLRADGIKAGYFRPITLAPFPQRQMRAAVKGAGRIVVAESAYGQLVDLVKTNLYGETIPIQTLLRPGVGITAEQIVRKVKELMRK